MRSLKRWGIKMRSRGRKAGRLAAWLLLFYLATGLAGLPGIAAEPVAALVAGAKL